MPKIETELVYRKKSSWIKEGDIHITRYVLVCGLIVFVEYGKDGFTGSYSRIKNIITETEKEPEFDALALEYSNLCKETPLSKQNVKFTR